MAVGNSTPQIGWQAAIGVAEETTWGTFVTATAWIEFNSESMKQSREEVLIEGINTTRDYTKRVIGNQTIEGSIEADLNPGSDGLVFFMKNAMGGTVAASTLSAADGSCMKHTIYPGDMESNKGTSTSSDVKGLSVAARKGATDVYNASGCRVNSLSIKGEVGAPVVINAELIGQNMSISSSIGVVSLSDVVPCIFSDVTIQTGDSITNVSSEIFTAFELVIGNNLDGDQRQLGSRNIAVLPTGRRTVKLTMSQRYDTTTAYDRFIQNTMTAIQIGCETTQTVGSAAGNTTYSLYIKVPKAYWNSNVVEVGGVETLVHELDITGLYDSEQGYSVLLEVVNGTANYW